MEERERLRILPVGFQPRPLPTVCRASGDLSEPDRVTLSGAQPRPGFLASMRRAAGIATLAAASLAGLSGVAWAQEPPQPPAVVAVVQQPAPSEQVGLPAVLRPGTSAVADQGTSPENVAGWRSFGHSPRNERWFDLHGNWADTETHVTADQYAAMPAPQQRAFRNRVGAAQQEVKTGNPNLALQRAAVGRAVAGERLDRERSFG
ncbi:MAG: hypothetical protein AB1758_38120, partial [Candidatus Eremiobacterota bacterium]